VLAGRQPCLTRPERDADDDGKGPDMNPGAGKPARKAMRVATIFIGAAAAAAFTPAAALAARHAAGTGAKTLTVARPHVRTKAIQPESGRLSKSVRVTVVPVRPMASPSSLR
jgi:hypothetical protein